MSLKALFVVCSRDYSSLLQLILKTSCDENIDTTIFVYKSLVKYPLLIFLSFYLKDTGIYRGYF